MKKVELKFLLAPLYKYLEKEGIDFIHFSLRWMLCLLTREFNFQYSIRLWDTYISEGKDFSQFHIYICAAFLIYWSSQLKKKDFSNLIIFLQHLPTSDWKYEEIDYLIETAYTIGYIEKIFVTFCIFGFIFFLLFFIFLFLFCIFFFILLIVQYYLK